MSTVETLVEEFTSHLAALVERETLESARHAIEAALGTSRPGRAGKGSGITLRAKSRKKLPKQLCPVPGCTNLAAPVFGMVCAEHKNVAKAKIKKYREARRAAKLGTKSKRTPAKAKGKKRPTPARKAKRAIKAASKPTTKKPARKKPIARRKQAKKVRPTAEPKAAQPAVAHPATTAAAA